jgi:hypothetical protein
VKKLCNHCGMNNHSEKDCRFASEGHTMCNYDGAWQGSRAQQHMAMVNEICLQREKIVQQINGTWALVHSSKGPKRRQFN